MELQAPTVAGTGAIDDADTCVTDRLVEQNAAAVDRVGDLE
jgi:hypothetical protein